MSWASELTTYLCTYGVGTPSSVLLLSPNRAPPCTRPKARGRPPLLPGDQGRGLNSSVPHPLPKFHSPPPMFDAGWDYERRMGRVHWLVGHSISIHTALACGTVLRQGPRPLFPLPLPPLRAPNRPVVLGKGHCYIQGPKRRPLVSRWKSPADSTSATLRARYHP